MVKSEVKLYRFEEIIRKKKAVIIAEKTTKEEENRSRDWVKTEEEMALKKDRGRPRKIKVNGLRVEKERWLTWH